LTAFYSYDQLSSLRFIVGAIALVFVYAVTKSVLTRHNLNDLLHAIANVGLVFNLTSLLLYFYGLAKCGLFPIFYVLTVCGGVAYDRGIPRLIGTTSDPNFFVLYSSLFFFIGLFFIRNVKFKILFLFSLLNIFLTFSRGGMLAILVGIVIYIILTKKKKYLRLFQLAIMIVVVALSIYFLLPGVVDFLTIRLSTIREGSGRFQQWSDGVLTFLENPLLGVGAFGYLQYNFDHYYGEYHMHNTFLEVLVEGGVFIFTTYLWFWILASYRLYRAYNRASSDTLKAWGACLLTVLCSTFVMLNSLSALVNEIVLLVFVLIAKYQIDVRRESVKERT